MSDIKAVVYSVGATAAAAKQSVIAFAKWLDGGVGVNELTDSGGGMGGGTFENADLLSAFNAFLADATEPDHKVMGVAGDHFAAVTGTPHILVFQHDGKVWVARDFTAFGSAEDSAPRVRVVKTDDNAEIDTLRGLAEADGSSASGSDLDLDDVTTEEVSRSIAYVTESAASDDGDNSGEDHGHGEDSGN